LSAQARLANFLLDISGRLVKEKEGDGEFHLSIDRHDIANYLGLTIGTVSRAFTTFRREGLLTASGKYIRLDDPQALLSIATNLVERGKTVRR
jgi:CRP/FNR family transcriptional regulator